MGALIYLTRGYCTEVVRIMYTPRAINHAVLEFAEKHGMHMGEVQYEVKPDDLGEPNGNADRRDPLDHHALVIR